MNKIIPVRPFLLVLFGYPGSGKTYFARQVCENFQAAHLESDKIRTELFETPKYDAQENSLVAQLMDYMTEEFLNAGVSVVYDANAMTAKERYELRKLAKRAHAQDLLVWFQADLETCFNRVVKRDKRKIDDKYAAKWDRTTFENIIAHMQKPTFKEEYLVLSGKHYFDSQKSALLSKLKEKGVVELGESMSMAKPGMVNLIPGPRGRVDMVRRTVQIR